MVSSYLTSIWATPMLKERRLVRRLSVNMGLPIPVRQHLYIKTGPGRFAAATPTYTVYGPMSTRKSIHHMAPWECLVLCDINASTNIAHSHRVVIIAAMNMVNTLGSTGHILCMGIIWYAWSRWDNPQYMLMQSKSGIFGKSQ